MMTRPNRQMLPKVAAAMFACLALLAASCTDDADPEAADTSDSTTTTGSPPQTVDGPTPPPINSFLAPSTNPIGHANSAQTDSVEIDGPTGPTAELSSDDLTYQHLGPAHFGIAISPEYEDGRRVIWSNGGDRISKLDYDTLEVLAELPIPDKELQTEAEADADIEELDTLSGDELATKAINLATQYLFGLTGVYYALDVDNVLFVGGAESVIAYQDTDPADPESDIEVRDEWQRPDEIGGGFVGANMTFDGKLVLVTDEGWVVVLERDFSDYVAAQLPGAEDAPTHNQAMLDAGRRPGSASWVRNSMAVGEDGGIYVPSVDHMHKVVWTGSEISTDDSDGAWSEPYSNELESGSGATPSLMGFGTEDKFVAIADGDRLMNVVIFWRDEIPDDWEQLPDQPSRRIAGSVPADMGDPDLMSIQTEQSVVTAGYGAVVVNNEPASIPDGMPPAGVRVLAGYAGADPAFTPHGVQKFEWDPDSREFSEAWVNSDLASPNSVPLVSLGSNILYTVGARDDAWTLEGIDWDTGESAFYWETGSARYNSLFSGINHDLDGRIVHTTTFGILRYDVESPAGDVPSP
jgi:hypothetical protein